MVKISLDQYWTSLCAICTLDFSSKYAVVVEPLTLLPPSKLSSIHLPKREELGFLIVFEFPNASRIGEAAIILPAMSTLLPSSLPSFFSGDVELASNVKKLRHCLVASVLPAGIGMSRPVIIT